MKAAPAARAASSSPKRKGKAAPFACSPLRDRRFRPPLDLSSSFPSSTWLLPAPIRVPSRGISPGVGHRCSLTTSSPMPLPLRLCALSSEGRRRGASTEELLADAERSADDGDDAEGQEDQPADELV
eukprot:183473-Prymnesium_polylepis.1